MLGDVEETIYVVEDEEEEGEPKVSPSVPGVVEGVLTVVDCEPESGDAVCERYVAPRPRSTSGC